MIGAARDYPPPANPIVCSVTAAQALRAGIGLGGVMFDVSAVEGGQWAALLKGCGANSDCVRRSESG
jgi:hypothetical protein